METNEIVKALRKEAAANPCAGVCSACDISECMTRLHIQAADQIEEAEGKVDAAVRTAKHYKEQRDAAVKQLRKIADCSTCRKDRPEGVDGPECVACTRGQNWEWNGGKV